MTNRIKESQLYTDYQSCSTDIISERVAQLNALLSSITGEGFDYFITLNNDIQSNLHWLACALIGDIEWHLRHPDEHLKGEARKNIT